MLTIVKPVILVNQFLGVCPHDIKGEILIFRKTSLKFFKTLFTIIILLLQLGFTSFQFSRALINGQSMVKLGFLFGAMTAPGIALLILGVTLQKRDNFTQFFVKCQEFKATVCMKEITNCPQVIRVAYKFYGFYMLLAVGQAILVAYDSLKHPNSEIYALHYLPLPTPPGLVALNCFYQFYLVIITQSACALVEVLCASVSCSIVNNIRKIQRQMKEIVEKENNIGERDSLNGGNFKNNMHNVLIQMTAEKEGKVGNAYGIPFYPTAPLLESKEESSPTEPIMTAIKRYSYISRKQRLINCIFGPILALDIAWLVIHVCLLFFLQIKSLGLQSNANSKGAGGFGGVHNLDRINNETAIPATSFSNAYGSDENDFYSNTSNRIGFFATQGLIYLIRLMIVLISLGNVHDATRWFDSEITSNLMKIKKPKSSDLQLIQVHLLGSQSNPVAFSAGGFFIFSRGTILYVFSIVTTYVIFMLQA